MRPFKELIYLDHAATTPIDSRVLKAMLPFLKDDYGNPSSLYQLGQKAKRYVEQSRADIASILNSQPSELIFTSGGTESTNMAIYGLAASMYQTTGRKGHIITTSIEHHAVLHPLQQLERFGWDIDIAPVDKHGIVHLATLQAMVKPDTNLVSVMYANNEIGSIQPIVEIGKWLNGLNKVRQQQGLPKIYLHTDACQAANELSLDVAELQVDLLTLNASKIYGPKGVGLLYAKHGTPMLPMIIGGDQENGKRAGTENVSGIVGFAKALQLAQMNKDNENQRLKVLQLYFFDRLSKKVSNISINGPEIQTKINATHQNRNRHGEPTQHRLYNNINICIDGVEGEALMLYLDSQNIAVSTGSACNAQSEDPSHVLLAIGLPKRKVYNSIRITLGHGTDKKKLDFVIEALSKYVPMLRGVTKES